MVFGLRSVSPQPMLLCVNMIAQIKFIDLKMNLRCSIFTKGQLILKKLVSEVGVLDWRAKKEMADRRLPPNFYYFSRIITFEVLGDAQVGSWLL